jgi:polysaccharide export outer membrane protein
MTRSSKYLLSALILSVFVWIPVEAGIAEYTIGPEDVLQISFWQDAKLDQTVTVRRDGKVTISIIGEITAGGLTPSQLGQKIGERANLYNPAISQAAVTVLKYNSQKVFIIGQVLVPGAYAFEELPDAWTLIKEAGGVTELADLSKVTVIRGSVDAGKIETMNLEKLVSSGETDNIPQLYPGDVVEVPRMPEGMFGTGLPKVSRERRNIVYVTGAVGRPGPVNLDEEMDVLDAIVMGGGSIPTADLKRVKVVSKSSDYSSVMTINLERYAEIGAPRRYVLRPEDTVVLPEKKLGFFRGAGWGTLRDLIAVTASVISTVVLIDRLKD